MFAVLTAFTPAALGPDPFPSSEPANTLVNRMQTEPCLVICEKPSRFGCSHVSRH